MNKKHAICIAALIMSCIAAFGVAACAPKEVAPPEPEYDFLFTGGGKIGGVDYTVHLEGNESSSTAGTFELTIEELPALALDGTYEYDTGKGYRFTFADKNDTIVVAKYDTTSQLFTVKYTLNLGESLGSGEVVLTYKDASFTPGNEVWFEPFSFYGFNDNVMNMTTLESTLFCYEDGTCALLGVCPLIAVPTRNGTYVYDEATKTYTFTFDPADNYETVYTTTYDEATNTYTVTVDQNLVMKVSNTLTYTPAD